MCHATHCWTLEEDFRIYKNTKMFYVLLHHSTSVWFRRRHFSISMFCLGGEMMFLLNSANIDTAAATDTFVGVLPAPGDPGEWPGWIMGGWREYWCGNDINGAVLLQLMETCSSPPAPDTDKLSCTALHAGTCTGRWSHPGADPIFRKQNTDLIK